jgi:hypothetical protein
VRLSTESACLLGVLADPKDDGVELKSKPAPSEAEPRRPGRDR